MFKKILLFVGRIEFPEKIIDYITEQVKENGSVILVKVKHALPPFAAVNSSDQFPIAFPAGAVTVMEKESGKLQRYLEKIASKLDEQGVKVEQVNLPNIETGDIGKFAKDHGVDLIIMTAHAYKGWRRLFLGSNIEDVLRESNIPILVFNPELGGVIN